MFYLKYDTKGNQVWNITKTWVFPSLSVIPTSIVIDNVGFIYSLIVSQATNDTSVVTFTTLNVMDMTGDQVWNYTFINISGYHIYIDAQGNVLITGMVANNYDPFYVNAWSIILVSSHALVNENINTEDILALIINAISDNLAILALFFIIIVLGVSIGLVYHYKNTLNLASKHFPLFSRKDPNMGSDPSRYHVSTFLGKKSRFQTQPIIATNIIEQILIENYQAPDYATALKVQQGGFPDFATYKRALEKGITTYEDWREKYP